MPAGTSETHPDDGWLVLAFATPQDFEDWLVAHHEEQPGLWLKFAKKGSGVASVTLPEAVEVATCFGWIDAKMHGVDDVHYVLRFQPRRARSNWAPRSKELAERLVAEGRMRPAGLAQVAAAKADGRWDKN
jgi:uncharacterized protein YdeI (YjbR/CyaY-like superfamily)